MLCTLSYRASSCATPQLRAPFSLSYLLLCAPAESCADISEEVEATDEDSVVLVSALSFHSLFS